MQTIQTGPVAELNSLRTMDVEFKFRAFPSAELAQRELERQQAELERLSFAGAAHGEIRRAITQVEGATGQLLTSQELAGRLRLIAARFKR